MLTAEPLSQEQIDRAKAEIDQAIIGSDVEGQDTVVHVAARLLRAAAPDFNSDDFRNLLELPPSYCGVFPPNSPPTCVKLRPEVARESQPFLASAAFVIEWMQEPASNISSAVARIDAPDAALIEIGFADGASFVIMFGEPKPAGRAVSLNTASIQ